VQQTAENICYGIMEFAAIVQAAGVDKKFVGGSISGDGSRTREKREKGVVR
jgi:hypothetical protein